MLKKLLPGLLVVLLMACGVSPTGRQQFTMLSPQELNTMGNTAFQQLQQKQPVETNPPINAYVQCVAEAIVAQLPGEQGDWEVVVFRDDAANAFALPGGNIGVHTGLLKVARNQDQLAAVIGHEIGHVLADHSNERMSQELLVQGGLTLADALAGGSGTATQQALMTALGLGAQVGILLPYSRVHESEADVIGLDLMARAGFDPRQSIELWQNMAGAGNGQPPEFLSTHPAHGTRIRDLEANMGQALQTYEAARAQGRRPRCQPPG